jgi:hypothetical protein
MRILEEEVEMGVDVHVNNDWSVVDDVVMQILQILLGKAQCLDSFHQCLLSAIVQPLAFVVHVDHSLILKICATAIRGIALSRIELFPLLASLIMRFLFSRGKFFITKDAEIFFDYKWRFFFTFHTDIRLVCGIIYYSEVFTTSWTLDYPIFFPISRFFGLHRFARNSFSNKFLLTIDTYFVGWVILEVAFTTDSHFLLFLIILDLLFILTILRKKRLFTLLAYIIR